MNDNLSYELLEQLRHYPISYKLQKLRVIAGYSQSELSKKAGLTQGIISQWENGLRIPSKKSLIHIAGFYGVPADFFIDYTLETIQFPKDAICSADIDEDGPRFK